MIPVREAQQLVLENIRPQPRERIPLSAAIGRVLQQEIRADMDMPPFDRSRMDGYALRAADASGVPARLRLVGEVAAGGQFESAVAAGEAVAIMTGAPLPSGADAVQKVEVTEADDQTVIINQAVKPGQFVTPRGSEAARGQVLIKPGQRITPADVAAMATFGCADILVSRRPVVNIFSTGSELVEVDQVPSASQIRNSNSYTIQGYVHQLGAQGCVLGIIPDDEALTYRRIAGALGQCDVLILSGGVSMGQYDFVKPTLRRLGAQIFFDRVCLHPGKPTVFAKFEDKAIFALPGNPVSVAVTFLTFAFPGLNAMMGAREKFLPAVRAKLKAAAKHAPDRRSFLPAELTVQDGRACVTPLRWGGSSDLVAFMRANALIMVPEGVPMIEAGRLCETLLIPQQEVH